MREDFIGLVQRLVLGPVMGGWCPALTPSQVRVAGHMVHGMAVSAAETAGEAHSLRREFGWDRLPRQDVTGLREVGPWDLSRGRFSRFQWTARGLTGATADDMASRQGSCL